MKWSLWLLLAASLLLAVAWGGLHGWIVPRIAEFRPALEKQATRVLGLAVRIGSVSARGEGLVPSFELQDVVLLDPQGREALRLPRVVVALSPRSLWNLGFEQLYIHQPRLAVRRTADGRFLVAGLDLSQAGDNGGRAADWFFRQGEFLVREGTLEWHDELQGAPPLTLGALDLVVRNAGRRHELRLDATPPADWGERFRITGRFRQPLLSAHPGRWQQWVGELHADFAAVDLSQLRRHARSLPVEIHRGRGRLRAWADLERGQWVGGTADVVLHEVSAVLGPGLQPLGLQSVSGRLSARRLPGGFELETQALQFTTDQGQHWSAGHLALGWSGGEGAALARGELRAERVDLEALGRIASSVPLGTSTHAALQAYRPQGRLEQLRARWQGPLEAPVSYEVSGHVEQLAFQAWPDAKGGPGSPGLRGLAADFAFTRAGGKAQLAIADGALEFPGVFEEPVLPFDRLSADLSWQRQDRDWRVALEHLSFANADAEGEGRLSWRTGAGEARLPGVLDLEARISRADGARVWRYLPLAVGAEARDYVRTAVASGQAGNASFRVQGDLRDFPFENGKRGIFRVTAQVRDVHLAYVPQVDAGPPWPALTQLSGELVFEGNGMQVREAVGRLAGAPRLSVQAQARIPDFDRSEVAVSGRIRGPLADALAVVNRSPAAALTDGALAQASGSGPAEVELKLLLPLEHIERSQVLGTLTLAGNELQVTPDSPALTRLRGAVLFSEQGFQLAGVQARVLGGETRLEGGTRPGAGGEVQLRAQGMATAEGLRQARELGFVARLARDLEGSAPYQMTLSVRRGHPELLVTSSLQGMALHLPAPLGKPAEAAMPLRYENALTRESLAAGAPLQELLSLELSRVGSAAFVRDLQGAQPQVVRGAIAIGLAPGEAVAMPAQGVAANLQLQRLDVHAWSEALERLAGGASGARAPAAPVADDAAMAYLPTVLAVRARELALQGRTLHNVVVGGSREGRVWRANATADELDGYLAYHQPGEGGPGRLHARLARLNIAASAAREVESLLEEQPGSIPALDVVVEAFELKDRKLGRLEIQATNRGSGGASRPGASAEWRLDRLALGTPEAQFTASGNWAVLNRQGGGEPRRTAIKFQLDIQDAGALLARFGMPGVVRGGRGSMEGHVGWIGSPLAFDYPSLSGRFHVDVQSGQFLRAEPGIAKLLGVLSLQSLPRRLALDFRDVFSDGFSFDFVRGDVTIAQGMAATNNLQMKGVNAAVLMEGQADIARETQDLKVVVVPEINAGTASLVATVINPAIGLGSFLAQMFLRQPLMRAATQEFQVDGTWAEPRVRRIERPAHPEAAAEPAAR